MTIGHARDEILCLAPSGVEVPRGAPHGPVDEWDTPSAGELVSALDYGDGRCLDAPTVATCSAIGVPGCAAFSSVL